MEELKESKNKNNQIDYDEKFKKISTKYFKYITANYLTDTLISARDYMNLKYEHTWNVIDYSRRIAEAERLNEEQIYIAKLIALFHDLGNFEERKRMTLGIAKEHDIPHADLSIQMLFENILDDNGNIIYNDNDKPIKLIDQFLVDEKYHKVIAIAVENHGKLEIDRSGMTETELLFSKIIRDADKLDIYRIRANENILGVTRKRFGGKTMENDLMADEVYERLSNGQTALISDFKSGVDLFMNTACFAYDMEFDGSLQALLDLGFLKQMQETQKFNIPQTQIRVNQIFSQVNSYIQERLRDREINKQTENKDLKKGLSNDDKKEIIDKLLSRENINHIRDNNENIKIEEKLEDKEKGSREDNDGRDE